MKVEPGFITDHLIDWLLAGDVAIQYQVRRDLLGEERPDLPSRWNTLRALRVLKQVGVGGK